MSNEEFLRDWLNSVWLEKDFAKAAKAFGDGTCTSHVAGETPLEKGDYETMVEAMCANFDVTHLKLSHIMEVGDEISALLEICGKGRNTPKDICCSVYLYRRIQNGKFVEAHSNPDYLSFYAALGQLPSDVMLSLMMGAKLQEV